MPRQAKTPKPPPPARIYFLPAAEAPLAVILRRKPAKLWHVALLNTNKGTIEHGSWFRGTLNYDKSHLSPDGKLMVYFAMGSDGRTIWTGVCSPPLLRTHWHIPDNSTWGGGGVWLNPRTLATSGQFNAGFIPPIPATTDKRKHLPLFDLVSPTDPLAKAAFERRTDRGDQALLVAENYPEDLWRETTSFALDYKGRLLVARRGIVEIWSPRDLKRGKPTHLIDLEPLQPPPSKPR